MKFELFPVVFLLCVWREGTAGGGGVCSFFLKNPDQYTGFLIFVKEEV